MKNIIFIALLIVPVLVFGQNKIKIDHTCYDQWKSIKGMNISPSGDLITYKIMPAKGDGFLYIQNSDHVKLLLPCVVSCLL